MITLVWKSLDGEIEITIKVWLIAQPYTVHRPGLTPSPSPAPLSPLSRVPAPART